MTFSFKDIFACFYFVYWIVNKTTPFSFWWIACLYILIYIIEALIASVMNKTSKSIEKSTKQIQESINNFDRRIKKIEESLGGY